MFQLNFAISIICFPGIIVHEFAHQLFCRLYGVAIYKVKYFQVRDTMGYVIHEIPPNPVHHMMISIGPFFVNTILGFIIAFPAAIPVIQFKSGTIFDYILLYLGVSIAMHAFPSIGDAQSIWNVLWKDKNTPRWLRLLCIPIVGIILAGAAGSMLLLHLVYGLFIACVLPLFIVGLCA